jgi:hypothetical protein
LLKIRNRCFSDVHVFIFRINDEFTKRSAWNDRLALSEPLFQKYDKKMICINTPIIMLMIARRLTPLSIMSLSSFAKFITNGSDQGRSVRDPLEPNG